MLMGIMSDTHDHLSRIESALSRFRTEDIGVLIHAGDLVAPFAAKVLKEWDGPFYVVYGNNDGERRGLKSVLPQITDGPILVESGGRRICVGHYPPRKQHPVIEGVDVIVYGHTNDVVHEHRDGILYLNPGECCGWVNGKPTVATLDTQDLSVEIIPVEDN